MKCRKHLDERCHTAKACYVQMPSRPGQVAAQSDTSVLSRCTPSFRHTAVNSGSHGGTQVHSRKSGRSTIDAVLICSSTATSFQKLQPGLSSCRCEALWPTDPANQNVHKLYRKTSYRQQGPQHKAPALQLSQNMSSNQERLFLLEQMKSKLGQAAKEMVSRALCQASNAQQCGTFSRAKAHQFVSSDDNWPSAAS